MLISVHIPKTGGASFKTLLQSHFGDKMLEVYNDCPMNKNTLFRNISAILSMIKSTGLSNKYDCIHGHFLPIKYRLIKKKSYVIWLREPAERLVSRYYHWKRNYLRNNKNKNRFVKNIDISVKEFCSIKHYQNIYSKYLWGMKIEMFDFIGITENYENS